MSNSAMIPVKDVAPRSLIRLADKRYAVIIGPTYRGGAVEVRIIPPIYTLRDEYLNLANHELVDWVKSEQSLHFDYVNNVLRDKEEEETFNK